MDNLNFKEKTQIVMLPVGEFQKLIFSTIGQKTESIKPEKDILNIEDVCELIGYAKSSIYLATSRQE